MSEPTILAQVKQCTLLTDTIEQVLLKPDVYIPYQAGQYLQIILGEECLSYSIANAPSDKHEYELHIRHSRDNSANHKLFAHIKQYGALSIKLPFGQCTVDKLHPKKPIIFIAAGTGFAPVHAMIEHLLKTKDQREFELFWAARSTNDFYMQEKLRDWLSQESIFKNQFFLSDNKETLATVVRKQHAKDLHDWQMVISGPFDMAIVTRDDLLRYGVQERDMFSDAFGA